MKQNGAEQQERISGKGNTSREAPSASSVAGPGPRPPGALARLRRAPARPVLLPPPPRGRRSGRGAHRPLSPSAAQRSAARGEACAALAASRVGRARGRGRPRQRPGRREAADSRAVARGGPES
ncbi:hypothetical protein VULLAG_LOCUS2252 [Vulpes lagopus]